jgi:hypothetical protein
LTSEYVLLRELPRDAGKILCGVWCGILWGSWSVVIFTVARCVELGGFTTTVTVERVLGSMNVTMALDGAPGTEVRMTPAEVKSADPGKLIIRLENRLGSLESLGSRSQSEIDQLTAEAAHARDDIARPFPQVGQLAAARDRVLRLEEQLQQTAMPAQHNGGDWLLAEAAVIAGLPGAAVVAASHQDGQPQSPTQASQCDFPVENPLVGAALATGQVVPKPRIQTPRVTRHIP